jgi:hypothetical protein
VILWDETRKLTEGAIRSFWGVANLDDDKFTTIFGVYQGLIKQKIKELERTIDDTNEAKKQIVEKFVKSRREAR